MHGEYSAHQCANDCVCICALTPVVTQILHTYIHIYFYNINMPKSLPCQCRNFIHSYCWNRCFFSLPRSPFFLCSNYPDIILSYYSVATNKVYWIAWPIVCNVQRERCHESWKSQHKMSTRVVNGMLQFHNLLKSTEQKKREKQKKNVSCAILHFLWCASQSTHFRLLWRQLTETIFCACIHRAHSSCTIQHLYVYNAKKLEHLIASILWIDKFLFKNW